MKINIFQNKVRLTLFLIFAHSSVQLCRRPLNSHNTSAFHLTQYVALVETYEENLASNKHVTGHEKSILITFSYIHGYCSLTLHGNTTSCCFLKVSCNGDSETTLINLLYSVTLNFINLSCTLCGPFTHA